MWNLLLSTAGCFVFTRGYGLIKMGREEPGALASISGVVALRTPLADDDAFEPVGGISDCSAYSAAD